jgi:membrane protease YdiL (CAAX protease family)
LFVEAILLLGATIASIAYNIPLKAALHISPTVFALGAAGGLGLAVGTWILLWLGKFSTILASLREITFEQIAPLFSDFRLTDLVLIAVVSGFCEEILFRGVMQPKLGLPTASFIFALLHCPSPRFFSYGIWVFIAGLLLGWSFSATGNLWVPISAHCVSNIASLIFLRYASSKIATPPTTSD